MSWYRTIKQAQQASRYLATIRADVWVPTLPDKGQEMEYAKEAIRNSVHSGDGSLDDTSSYMTRFETEVKVQPYG